MSILDLQVAERAACIGSPSQDGEEAANQRLEIGGSGFIAGKQGGTGGEWGVERSSSPNPPSLKLARSDRRSCQRIFSSSF